MAVQALAHRRYARPVNTGFGVFAGLASIQDPARVIGRGLIGSLMEQPGIRLAEATGRRIYFGTTRSTPQRFAVPPSQVNRRDQVRAGRAVNSRRSLGRMRGLAPEGIDYAA